MSERFAGKFDPDAVRAMTIAFDKACKELGLANTQDGATDSLAKLVVEQARTGERDPDTLCAMTLEAIIRTGQ